MRFKIITGLLSLGLLAALIYKLLNAPYGLIPFMTLAIVSVLIIGLLLTYLVKLVFKIKDFLSIYFLATAVLFVFLHFKIHSPTLNIVVPENYSGQVRLFLSSTTDNILTLDKNGFGYLNERTYEKVFTRPNVVDIKGRDLTEFCRGFSDESFWGENTTCCVDDKFIQAKTFKIMREDKTQQNELTYLELLDLVDKKLVKGISKDRYIKDKRPSTKEQ